MSKVRDHYRNIRYSTATDNVKDIAVIYAVDPLGNTQGVFGRISSKEELHHTLEEMREFIVSLQLETVSLHAHRDKQSEVLLTIIRQHSELVDDYLSTIGPDATIAQRTHLAQLMQIGASYSQLFLSGGK